MTLVHRPMQMALVALTVCLLALLPSINALSNKDQDTLLEVHPLNHELSRLVSEKSASSLPSSFMESTMSVGAAKYKDYCTQTKLADLEKLLPATPSRTRVQVGEDDLICYYASPIFNLKGIYGKNGSPTCKNGIHLSTAAKGSRFTTFAKAELDVLKNIIFNISRDKHNKKPLGHTDVATTTTLETVARSFTNQRVLLFLFDADTGCVYPVAHNVYPASKSAPKGSPHTEAILKDIGLLDREGMLSVVSALYKTNLASAKNLVRMLYTWYAPCENCSNTLMSAFAATTKQFKGNAILFNRAVCNGVKDYRAECLEVTMKYDAGITSLHQITVGNKVSSENINSSKAGKATLNAPKTTGSSTSARAAARTRSPRTRATARTSASPRTRATARTSASPHTRAGTKRTYADMKQDEKKPPRVVGKLKKRKVVQDSTK